MQPPPPRGSGTQSGAFTFAGPLQEEDQILEAVLAAMMRGVLPEGTWERLHAAARRDDRMSELGAAFDAVSQGKRIKAAPPGVAADFLVQAAVLFGEGLGDAERAVGVAERAVALAPGHAAAFVKLEELLVRTGDGRRLAEAYATAAPHRPRPEQAPLFRRAAQILGGLEGQDDRVIELLQHALRLDPGDEDSRRRLEAVYLKANRPRDIVRMHEQALTGDPEPDEGTRRRLLARIVELYADTLREAERALPFVEQLLALDPTHELGRAVAQRLVVVKGLAGRAAAALVQAYEVHGTPQDLARYLTIELESTRGPRRAQLLARLGRLRAERLHDDKGAFEAYDQALLADAGEDDLRARYVALAGKLGRWLEAAKTFGRAVATARDTASRARASAQLGEILVRSGDTRRGRATLAGVLASPDAPPDAHHAAARVLREVLEGERDTKALADVLERLALLEPDLEARREVDERLADLAAAAGDTPRLVAAYERLLETSARARALAALAPLYEATGDPVKHARLLEEQSKDTADVAAARELAMRAATIRVHQAGDPGAAIAACHAVVERFGAARDVLELLSPLLEAGKHWPDLAAALAQQAELASGTERAALLSRLGLLRLQRLRDVDGAIAAFDEALAFDVTEKAARATLEKLAAYGDHRLQAARVLEPVHRREGGTAALLKLLELRGALAPDPDDRLAALREAATLTEDAGGAEAGRALDLVGRALAEAVASGRPLGEWLERLDALARREGTDPRRHAVVLAAALGEHEVASDELVALARRAAEAHAAAGDAAAGIAFYRRALVHAPRSRELMAALDELLRTQGSAPDRVALHRAALAEAEAPRRRELRLRIATIERHDLRDVGAAIATCLAALEDDASDPDAQAMLGELYAETGRWDELCTMLERGLEHAGGDAARALRARLTEVASRQGDEARARRHGAALVEDAGLLPEHLDVVEAAADRIGDAALARAVLVRRAEAATSPAEKIPWLERLGELDESRRSDLDAAAGAWKTAGALALDSGDDATARRLFGRARRVTPDDRELTLRLVELCERGELWAELPPLYGALVEQALDDGERVDLLLRSARVREARLGDLDGAARRAARAFELAPWRRDTLEALERTSVAAGALDALERAIDDALGRPGSPAALDAEARAQLQLARARALSWDPARADDAARAHRALLSDPDQSEAAREQALAAFESLLERDSQSPRRLDDRRWLLEWRAARAPETERAARLLSWARFEEQSARDAVQALGLYRQALAIDPGSDEALASVARLALATGDTDEALVALGARRDRAEGAARAALEVEMAQVLLERTTRWQEALGALQSVLGQAPDDPTARALASQLVAHRATRAGAIAMLEQACSASSDGLVREQILERLLDAPADAEDAGARLGWFERLADLQRARGDLPAAMATTVRAAREMPDATPLWDRAEELARALPRPDEVAALYEDVLGRALGREATLAIGERAVQFYEEWFEDRAKVARILERVLELDPNADWAFDRLKLLLDSAERWDDLFALYDRALERAEGKKQIALLEEAVQTAKDFADRPDRAIGYLERLRALRPADAKLSSALERLYERQGRHRELVALLTARMPAWQGADGRRGRTRVALLWLDELGDPGQALDVLEPLLASGGAPAGPADEVDPWAMLERILAAATAASDPARSTRPPTSGRGKRTSVRPKRSEPPASAGATVRQRATALLREHYARSGRDADLARVLTLELESIRSNEERERRHVELAELHERLGDLAAALDHRGAAFVLAPADDDKRAKLEQLAEATGRFERLADLLAAAADVCVDPRRRVELTMSAARLRADRVADARGAIALLSGVATTSGAGPDEILEAARRLVPLLATAGRAPERLEALERVASLETDPAARREALGSVAGLAVELGQTEAAIAAWERCVEVDASDLEALGGLVDLLGREQRSERLVWALDLRARSAPTADGRRADRVAIAELLGEQLERPHEAIAAWREIERDFGEADDAALALAELLRRTGRWSELADLLERRVTKTAEATTRAELLRHLAEVQHGQLGDDDLAMTSYERALEADPRSARARAGLLELGAEGERRVRAVGAVLKAVRAADDWRGILELTPLRLLAAHDLAERLEALEETARVAETRADDAAAAFDALRQAFLLDPGREHVGSELARVAGAAGLWDRLVEAYRGASDAVEERDLRLASRLRAAMGGALEVHLGDPARALDAYLRVADDADDVEAACTAVRLAGQLGRWAVAAAAVVARAGGDDASATVLDALERAAEASGAWREAAVALEDATRTGHLRASAARNLEARRAVWLRDRVGDTAAAEAAFASAVSHDPRSEELLEALATLQRGRRDRALVETLGRLSSARGGDLGLLREAAEVASDASTEPGLARAALGDLLALAEARLAAAEGEPGALAAQALWAIERLSALAEQEGDWQGQADVLARGEALPFEPAVRADLRRRAARVALDRVGDHDRAIELYLGLLADDPHDEEAAGRLAETYRAHGRRRDLLALREVQIAAMPDAARRVPLRLEAAELLVSLGEPARALEVLRSSLADDPAHAPTVEALAAILESEAAWPDLRELLAGQAHRAEGADPARSAGYWRRAARVAEERLRDPRLAEAYYQRTVALEPGEGAFDALARLSSARGDPAAAAGWLDRMLGVVAPGSRETATLRLADALLLAGDGAGAADRLEQALAADPGAVPLRERLAQLYRDQKSWPRLAALTASSAEHAPDPATRLARLLEAAEVYTRRCDDPERAVALLEEASQLAPDDPHVRLDLAGALAGARQFEPARAILQAMLESFGGRRPKERAPVHYQIARLELTMGNRAGALAELDAATRIDPQNPEILRTLGALARDDGQLDRAEKSYRALLAVLRRRDDAAGPRGIARSEILLELSAIAGQQAERERALEILESALEAASQSDFEQERLEASLRARGDHETLVRVLEGKLARGGEPAATVKTLGELAEVLAERPGRTEQALSARLRAVMLDPRSPATHEAALALARSAGGFERYLDCAGRLADDALAAGDTGLASALLLRLGDVAERDLRDDRRAAALRERALAEGVRTPELLRALDRVYERLGEGAQQARILTLRVEVDAAEGGPAAASDATYRLAALLLSDRSTVDAGVATLRAALEADPQLDRVEPLLRGALERDPAHLDLLDLYERVGREPGRERALVDALRLRAELPGADLATLREAVETATRVGEPSLAEAMLERLVAAAPGEGVDVATLGWALVSLAGLRAAAGDVRRSVDLKRAAARIADPEVARRLELEVARTAAEELGDLKVAAESYELLHERDPADREAWEPLAAAYRRAGEATKLAALLARVVDFVDDLTERGRLRLERVKVLVESRGLADADAAPLLREVIDEDPSQVEAALMLAAILERAGSRRELAELLSRQIDAAKDRADAPLVASLALRLGALLIDSDRFEARNVYYVGLEWEPGNRELLAALSTLLESEEDAAPERADVLERQLAVERGPAAEAIALRLAEMRAEQGDEAAAERALELGFRANPTSAALRDSLERALRERREWARLAELYVIDAAGRSDPAAKVARLREAAALRRNELFDARGAADALALARATAPDDAALGDELVDALVAAGDTTAATAELSAAIARTGGDERRAGLLATRARVRSSEGDHTGAIEDLEAAFAIDRKAFAAALADALDLGRGAAESAGDALAARALRLRAAQVLPYAGEVDEARAALEALLEQDPGDRAALRTLASLESALKRWDAAAESLGRLAFLEEDPTAVVAAALGLADVCELGGRLGEAREALERARAASPLDPAICARLEAVYDQAGSWHELAALIVDRGRASGNDDERFAALLRAGDVLASRAGDAASAVPLLEEARAERPADPACLALLADALVMTGQAREAFALLEQAIAPSRSRRLRELAPLHLRQARAARALGDAAAEHRALSQALECDAHSGEVCAEVATRAAELEQLDLANRALRAVTLLKTPGPMSKALAYQYMGEIARRQGDPKRALMLLKRALAEDATLEGARALIDALER